MTFGELLEKLTGPQEFVEDWADKLDDYKDYSLVYDGTIAVVSFEVDDDGKRIILSDM